MRRGAGVGGGEASEPRYVAGQFDDALVVDVVQHKIEVSDSPARSPLATAGDSPIYGWKWRKYSPAVSLGGTEIAANSAAMVLGLWDSGVRRQAAPSAGDTPVSLGIGRTELTWTH